jgi:hypothetical protein
MTESDSLASRIFSVLSGHHFRGANLSQPERRMALGPECTLAQVLCFLDTTSVEQLESA